MLQYRFTTALSAERSCDIFRIKNTPFIGNYMKGESSMNFIETLEELRNQTSKIEVLAIDGYTGKGEKDIGIRRRTIFDETMEDPVVDHMPFMICGDIYDADRKRISNVKDLSWRIDVGAFVRLRAIPGYMPGVAIDLGEYNINCFSDYVPNEQYVKVYRLSLERKVI